MIPAWSGPTIPAMADITEIAWTDRTWNPWWGCTKVSPGCENCYAEREAIRRKGIVWGKGKQRFALGDDIWRAPEKWNAQAAESGIRLRKADRVGPII